MSTYEPDFDLHDPYEDLAEDPFDPARYEAAAPAEEPAPKPKVSRKVTTPAPKSAAADEVAALPEAGRALYAEACESGLTHAEALEGARAAVGGHSAPAEAAPPAPKGKRPYVHVLEDYTNATIAALFIGAHADEVRHITDAGAWLVWDGKRWVRNEKQVLRMLAKVVADKEAEYKAAQAFDLAQAKASGNAAKVKETKYFWDLNLGGIQRYKNIRTAKDALASAATDALIEVEGKDLDAKPMLLNVDNGTVDLTTGDLLDHDPKHLLTVVLNVRYNKEAKCPTWNRALFRWLSNDPDYAKFVQKALGYTLTGSTKQECLFFPFGSGRNGKSTMLKVIQRLLGDYAVTAPDNLLTSGHNGVAPHDVATLQGVRMAVAPEVDGDRHFVAADLKRMSSRDTLRACRKYEAPFTFDPSHKLWLTGNVLPVVRNDDEGTWRRLIVLPFLEYITDEELDLDLDDTLLAESEGILNWLVRGCLAWQRDGLTKPAKVLEATEKYRSQMDLLGSFLGDVVVEVEDDEVRIGSSDLYAVYKAWCAAGGQKAVCSQKAFSLKLEQRGWQKRKSSVSQWAGRAFRDDLPPHLDPRVATGQEYRPATTAASAPATFPESEFRKGDDKVALAGDGLPF